MRPSMQADEVALFQSLLSCAMNYLEFGTGGSTVVAADLVRGSITSVDSSKEWLDKVRSACEGKATQPHLLHVDIGPTREWGFPTDRNSMPRWPNYFQAANDVDADLILIDGRFRVACFMQTLLRCRSDAIVAIHDYGHRPAYHVVERFARPLARARDLVAFQRRPVFDHQEAFAVLMRHAFEAE